MQILLGLAGSAARGCPAQAEYDLDLFGGNFNGPQIYVFSARQDARDPTPDPAPRRFPRPNRRWREKPTAGVKDVGEPCARERHARSDGRTLATERRDPTVTVEPRRETRDHGSRSYRSSPPPRQRPALNSGEGVLRSNASALSRARLMAASVACAGRLLLASNDLLVVGSLGGSVKGPSTGRPVPSAHARGPSAAARPAAGRTRRDRPWPYGRRWR
jgi:hypothetical protein